MVFKRKKLNKEFSSPEINLVCDKPHICNGRLLILNQTYSTITEYCTGISMEDLVNIALIGSLLFSMARLAM